MFTLLLLGGAVWGGWQLNNYISNIGAPQKKVLKAGLSGATAAVQSKIDSFTNRSK